MVTGNVILLLHIFLFKSGWIGAIFEIKSVLVLDFSDLLLKKKYCNDKDQLMQLLCFHGMIIYELNFDFFFL